MNHDQNSETRRNFGHLGVGSVGDDAPLALELQVLGAREPGEPPLAAGDDPLPPGELELGPAQRLVRLRRVRVAAPHGKQHLADADPGAGARGLAEGAAHPGLQAVGAGAGEHLVDAEDVERVRPHPEVERVLAGVLGHVLVARDPGRLQGLARHVLLLPAHQVHAQRELVHAALLLPHVEDPDLGVRHAAAVPGLGVRLVLDLTVAPRWPCTRSSPSSIVPRYKCYRQIMQLVGDMRARSIDEEDQVKS
jgi:hypothetical protein